VSKNTLKSYLNTSLGIVESQILLNSDIYYSLRPIILFANTDVSRHILVVDTSVFMKSNMGRREYNEKVGLATRLDLVHVFWSEIDFTQCSLKLE
jgi:hypothetical protein